MTSYVPVEMRRLVEERAKGSDIGSLSSNGELIRLFNPRTDAWMTHFKLVGSRIQPQSDIGEVTVKILKINAMERRCERELLQQAGRYPPNGMPPRRRLPK